MSPQTESLVICVIVTFVSHTQGLQFSMDTALSSDYSRHLRCSFEKNITDNKLAYVRGLAVYDVTESNNSIKLASLSVDDLDLCLIKHDINGIIITGKISISQAEMTLDLMDSSYCLYGSFMCALEFENFNRQTEVISRTLSPGDSRSCHTTEKEKHFKLETKVVELEKENVKLKNKIVEFEKENDKLKKQALEQEKENVKLKKQALEQEKENFQLKKQALDQEKENDQLKKKALDQEKENDQLKKQALDQEEENIKNKNKVVELERVQNILSSHITHENKIAELEREYIAHENKIAKLEREYITHENKTVKLEREYISLENKTVKLEREYISLENTTVKLEREYISLENKVVKHENEIVKLKKQALDLEKENDKLIEQVDEFEKENVKCVKEISDIKQQNMDLKTEVARLEDVFNLTIDTIQTKHDSTSPPPRYSKVATCVKGMTHKNSRERVLLWDKVPALCDTETDGGGWIVIQRRTTEDVNFYRGWKDYKNGFGTPETNFWLGNDVIHNLTSQGYTELRVDMEYQGRQYFAHYSLFYVAAETSLYRLSVSGYSGTAKDSLAVHDGRGFTTFDKDNDENTSGNCASVWHGAWWYNRCHDSNLNGMWGSQNWSGLGWVGVVGPGSVSLSEMKVRHV